MHVLHSHEFGEATNADSFKRSKRYTDQLRKMRPDLLKDRGELDCRIAIIEENTPTPDVETAYETNKEALRTRQTSKLVTRSTLALQTGHQHNRALVTNFLNTFTARCDGWLLLSRVPSHNAEPEIHDHSGIGEQNTRSRRNTKLQAPQSMPPSDISSSAPVEKVQGFWVRYRSLR